MGHGGQLFKSQWLSCLTWLSQYLTGKVGLGGNNKFVPQCPQGICFIQGKCVFPGYRLCGENGLGRFDPICTICTVGAVGAVHTGAGAETETGTGSESME
jgi:hypothetical protein